MTAADAVFALWKSYGVQEDNQAGKAWLYAWGFVFVDSVTPPQYCDA
ncbi:MAG TPA: hypothetical protein VFU55_04700 [Terracidiphilus sp.]|nr:hypothetical protein [Terracidiphilus sp.]